MLPNALAPDTYHLRNPTTLHRQLYARTIKKQRDVSSGWISSEQFQMIKSYLQMRQDVIKADPWPRTFAWMQEGGNRGGQQLLSAHNK